MRDALSLSYPPAHPRAVSPIAPPSGVGLRPLPALARTALARPAPVVPQSLGERMRAARDRIRALAEEGRRMRSYEVALDLDMSEFHFARQFRVAFGRSPHVFYDEIRADRARTLLAAGLAEGEVARRIGFRRPAELRALLSKRAESAAA